MRFSLPVRTVLAACCGAAVAMSVASCGKTETAATGSPKATPDTAAPAAKSAAGTGAASAAPAAPAAAPAEVRKMIGKWLRSDGTYVLELREAEAGGTMRAGYFNPKSINVSRAIWMRGAEGLQIAVELNDVGYPGAMYVLNYDAKEDRLSGKYTQPQMQQTFEVDFVRQKYP